ncbi:DUF481 domain-containing protein [Rheinheimera sp. 4Y26]|uniref:DUF481 domain-containing protein n=1 Tax=Rheinheimera sp. 4Y26 TaxID=2977811 RepID=UPI0021B09EB2|nr:DUF481 domain-containing protein [Rheinheimera sp. 4Y26]MCT6698883.1 DUF481 domain-containing protein [Rheinheimera sp. 4Y26]
MALFSLPLLAQQVQQSRIQMHNGDVLTGQILNQTDSSVTLQPGYSAAIVLKRSDIQHIQPVKLAQHDNTARQTVQQATAQSAWSLEFDVSASNRYGKQDASLFNLVSSAEYRQGSWRSALDLNYDYELKEQAPKTHQYKISPAIDYYLQQRLFWRLTGDYQYNYLAADYKNIDLSTGPGYAVLQQQQLQLDLTLMAGLKRASFRDTEPLRSVLADTSLSYHFVAMEWDFKYRLSQWPLEIYSEGNLLKLLNQPLSYLHFNYELLSNTGLRYRLSDRVRLSWTYEYNLTDLEAFLPRQQSVSFDIKDLRQKLSIGASF